MAIIINGPRFAGNHALSTYLKLIGLRRYKGGLFENGVIRDKRGERRKRQEWGFHLKAIQPDEFGTSHSVWSRDLWGHTILQVRRDPVEIFISFFRRRVRRRGIVCNEANFDELLRSYDKFYKGTARLDTWDIVPFVNIFDYREQFTFESRQRLCEIVGRPFVPGIEHWGIGHSFSGGNSGLDLDPFKSWWTRERETVFWQNWNHYRDATLAKTRSALLQHGITPRG